MERWFYWDAEQSVGPFSAQKLIELRKAGLIKDQTMVCSDQRPAWVSFSELHQPSLPPPLSAWYGEGVTRGVEQRVIPSRAWRRFGARLLDTFIHSTIGASLIFMPLGFFAPQTAYELVSLFERPEFKIIDVIVGTFLAAFVGAIPIAFFGRTIGKWIFGLRVLREDGSPIGVASATKRELAVWVNGLALGIPIASAITQAFAFRRLTQNGATTWDQGQFSVVYRPSGGRQTLLNVVGVCLCILAMLATYAPR